MKKLSNQNCRGRVNYSKKERQRHDNPNQISPFPFLTHAFSMICSFFGKWASKYAHAYDHLSHMTFAHMIFSKCPVPSLFYEQFWQLRMSKSVCSVKTEQIGQLIMSTSNAHQIWAHRMLMSKKSAQTVLKKFAHQSFLCFQSSALDRILSANRNFFNII